MKALEPLVLSDRGPLLLHAHANGYPPEVYRSFLEPFLDAYQIRAIYLRPFWPGSNPESLKAWQTFQKDYLDSLPGHLAAAGQDSLIGMGHSLGAMTTLMAAMEAPERFRALVIIEPSLFPSWMGIVMRALGPYHIFRYIHPLVRRTMKRKTSFPDRESMFINYRQKRIFANIPDHVLWDYVRGLAVPEEDGTVSLKYSPEWEVCIYEAGGSADPYVWRNLRRITCPVLVLRGERSDTLGQRTLERIARELPNGRAMTLPSVGHLLPLEAPERVAAAALDFLGSVL